MKQVLITGGAGFIGSHLAERLAADPDIKIVIVDDLSTGRQANLPRGKNVSFVRSDPNHLRQIEKIFDQHPIDYVFHYAAVVGVKRTLENPVDVLEDIEGIRNLLILCKAAKVKRIYFSSSSEVYGESTSYPQHEETTPLNSRLPYAVVKNVGESFLRSYHQEYGLDYTIFRFFNTYGPRQRSDFVISKFIQAAQAGRPITIFGDGSQTRTFCYIDDNIEACLRAFNDNLIVNDVVNIGTDQEVTIQELAEMIIRLTKSTSKIVHLPPLPEGDMPRRQPDTTKMLQLLGREFTPFEVGLKQTIAKLKPKAPAGSQS